MLNTLFSKFLIRQIIITTEAYLLCLIAINAIRRLWRKRINL
jgi:hypothetical protein